MIGTCSRVLLCMDRSKRTEMIPKLTPVNGQWPLKQFVCICCEIPDTWFANAKATVDDADDDNEDDDNDANDNDNHNYNRCCFCTGNSVTTVLNLNTSPCIILLFKNYTTNSLNIVRR